MQRILKALALAVAVSFLAGAVLTAARTSAAAPDAGAPDSGSSAAAVLDDGAYFNASKSGPMPRPRRPDGGTRTFFPATKSPGGMAIPQEQSPRQQAP